MSIIKFTPFINKSVSKFKNFITPIRQNIATDVVPTQSKTETVQQRAIELPKPVAIDQPKAVSLKQETVPIVRDSESLIDWNNQTREGKGRAAKQYLMQRLGLKDYQAAALVGSFMRESGLNINAENKAEKAGKNPAVKASQYGIGIGQWTHSRHDDLVNWITKNGNTLQSQLDFAADEIIRKYPQFLNMLKQSENSDEASDYVFAMYTGANYTKANKNNRLL